MIKNNKRDPVIIKDSFDITEGKETIILITNKKHAYLVKLLDKFLDTKFGEKQSNSDSTAWITKIGPFLQLDNLQEESPNNLSLSYVYNPEFKTQEFEVFLNKKKDWCHKFTLDGEFISSATVKTFKPPKLSCTLY